MKHEDDYDDVSCDADGKTFRYRHGVYTTLFWLTRHPDGSSYPGLFRHIWLNIALSLLTLLILLLVASHVRSMGLFPGIRSKEWILSAMVIAVSVFQCYRHAKSMRRFAVAIDLEARICPACGYPLKAEADGTTDATCSECGRRWTWAAHSGLTRMPQARRQREKDRQA